MATADKKLHLAPFSNEPFTDFSKTENRQAMEAALKKVKGELGREYPLRIGGETIHTPEKIRSINPSHPSEVVGIFQNGGVELANRAVDVAAHVFESWKHVPAEERAGCCFRTSEILRRRKLELSAWLTYEIGKTWPEADADIAELIDLCE